MAITEILTSFFGTGWGVAAGCVGVFVAVMALFWKWDDVFSKDFKEDVSLRLLLLKPPSPDSSVPAAFIRLFDAIFAKRKPEGAPPLPLWRRLLSWRCFFRSVVASLVAVVVVYAFFVIAGVSFESDFDAWNIFVAAIIINVVPDYLSLWETRFLLEWMRRKPSVFRALGLILLDVLMTALVFLAFPVVVGFTLLPFPEPSIHLQAIVMFHIMYIEVLELAVLAYSTFFTSVWLWLYAMSHFTIQLLSRTGPTLRLLKYILPIEERPFRSIGLVAATFAAGGYLLVAVFARL